MVNAGKHEDGDSAEDALVLEEVDEHEYEGRIGGFLSERNTIYLRLYPDGTLDGHVRQRKKPTMTGLVLLSTSRKRKLQTHSDHGTTTCDVQLDSVLCAFIQGRWMRRGDGHVCHFKAMKRQGHDDRQTLTCRAELQKNGTATGTWQLAAETRMAGKTKSPAIKKHESDDDDDDELDSEDDEETEDEMIQNVFDWRRVDRTTRDPSGSVAPQPSQSKDPLALYPLTPGTYQFRGFTTYTMPAATQTQTGAQHRRKRKLVVNPPPPPQDECFVSMELLADGTLKGKSREVAYPQSCPIKGTWEIGRVRYVLEYKVREAVGFFKYSGRVTTPDTNSDDDRDDGNATAKPADETRARTLGGKWRNVDDGPSVTPGYAGGRGHFELTCVHRSNLSTQSSTLQNDDESKALVASQEDDDDDDDAVILLGVIRVLTTGSYVLKGMAIDEDGYEYESQLEVELLADGSVRGVCRELVFQQIQRLRGNWTRTTLQYELEYVVKREVGIYWYQGKLDSDGLVVHGAWCNQELLLENKMDPHANYRGEKGTFSYAILEATRRWSHTSHRDFPRMFRDRVRCVLLCSQRTHVLPSALWPKIFAFCGQEWFHVPTRVVPLAIKQE